MAKKLVSHTIIGPGIGTLLDSLTSGRFEEVVFRLHGGHLPIKITSLSNLANRDHVLEFTGEYRHKNRRRPLQGTYDWVTRSGEVYLTAKIAASFSQDLEDLPEENLD